MTGRDFLWIIEALAMRAGAPRAIASFEPPDSFTVPWKPEWQERANVRVRIVAGDRHVVVTLDRAALEEARAKTVELAVREALEALS